jgi:hypothetical protein
VRLNRGVNRGTGIEQVVVGVLCVEDAYKKRRLELSMFLAFFIGIPHTKNAISVLHIKERNLAAPACSPAPGYGNIPSHFEQPRGLSEKRQSPFSSFFSSSLSIV